MAPSRLAPTALLLRAACLALWCCVLAPLPARAHDTLPPGIAWIDGDVERALAEARTRHQPLFLYWGAVWCPPCNQVKALLFRRGDFQQRLRAFLPVYLDGDGEAAQRWGDHFHVVGYPTLLVLDAEGRELSRLYGETDPERILRVLDSALQAGHPVRELMARARRGEALAAADWQLLASHGWQLEEDSTPAQRSEWLADLAVRAPPALPGLAGRFWLQALSEVGTAPPQWDAAQVAAAIDRLLVDPALALDSRDVLLFPAEQALGALATLEPAARARLRQDWLAALHTLSANAALSCTERLHMRGIGISLQLDGRAPEPANLDAATLAGARSLVHDCDRDTRDAVERQSVVSAANGVLQHAGLYDEAAALLEDEIPRARAPEYFLLDRADLAREHGQGSDAIEWSAQAYAAAGGGATRLQWGLAHLRDLLAYAPQQHAVIVDFAALLLRDAQRLPDAFADRNLRSLRQLDEALQPWQSALPADAPERKRLAAAWRQLCSAAPPGRAPAGDPCRGRPDPG